MGLRGEVEVAIESDHPGRFAVGSVVLSANDMCPLTVRTARRNRGRMVISFDEVTDRTGAEELKGTELVVTTENARPLESDEYWDHDLIGCTVHTVDGVQVGRVTDVLHSAANDVLVVMGEREHLIPLIGSVVKTVEPGHRITIEPMPGLLD